MKPGDLVTYVSAYDLKPRTGIIVKILKLGTGPFDMNVYEVLRADGTLDTYTSAAVRDIEVGWDRASR